MSKTKFVMRVRLSGARNGVPWPNIGEPLPDDLSEAEVAGMVAAGFVGEADNAASDTSTDSDESDAPATPRARARKTAAKA